jgi:hypothetical protein
VGPMKASSFFGVNESAGRRFNRIRLAVTCLK